MVMIAMCLGLRVSEIRALQWQDFDLKRRIHQIAVFVEIREIIECHRPEHRKLFD